MDIGVGKKGLSLTWQENFPEHADCPYCGGKETADIAVVIAEDVEDEYICGLHDNDFDKWDESDDPGYWVHDACAIAVYFCRRCLKTVAETNQA